MQPSTIRSAAEEAILWSAIKDAVTKRYEAARVRALAEMEEAGALRMKVRAEGDRAELGTLNTAEGKWIVEVDEDALLAWVQDHRPGEWYQTAPRLKIRDSYVKALEGLAIADATSGGAGIPTQDGQPVPGVRAVWRPGSTTVSANATAKGRAAEFLEALFTTARGLPAPTNGDTDEPGDRPPWDEPSAVPAHQLDGHDGGPTGPRDVLAELRRRVAHAASLPGAHGPDHSGGLGGPERPEPARPVVPGQDRSGDGWSDVPAAQLAGGLLGAVAGHYAHPRAHPDAVTVADIDAYTEPEPVRVTDIDEPAPF